MQTVTIKRVRSQVTFPQHQEDLDYLQKMYTVCEHLVHDPIQLADGLIGVIRGVIFFDRTVYLESDVAIASDGA